MSPPRQVAAAVGHLLDRRPGPAHWASHATDEADKAALLTLIAGLAVPVRGELKVLGEDMRTHRGRAGIRYRVGLVPPPAGRAGSPCAGLSCMRHGCGGCRRPSAALAVGRAIDRLNLAGWACCQIKAVPEEVARRAWLAACTVHEPDLLLVDGLLDTSRTRTRRLWPVTCGHSVLARRCLSRGAMPRGSRLCCPRRLTLTDGIALTMADSGRPRPGANLALLAAAGRHEAPVMLVSVVILGIAGAWRALTPGMAGWDFAGDALLDSVRGSGPVAAGLAAWLTIRSERSGLGRLERLGHRSAAAGPLTRLGVAASAALAGYALTAGAVSAWVGMHDTIRGSLQAQEVAAGAAALLVHVTAGFLVALLCCAAPLPGARRNLAGRRSRPSPIRPRRARRLPAPPGPVPRLPALRGA